MTAQNVREHEVMCLKKALWFAMNTENTHFRFYFLYAVRRKQSLNPDMFGLKTFM